MPEAPGSYSGRVRALIRSPIGRAEPRGANARGTDANPVCGDEMTVWLVVESGVVREAGFEVNGCAPSIAAGSAAMDLIVGRSLADAGSLAPDSLEAYLGGLPRVKRHVALLASRAVRNAVRNYQATHPTS